MPDDNYALRRLSRGLIEKIKPRLRDVKLTERRVLFSSGEQVDAVYFPRSGAVSLVVELASGATIESAIVGHDSLVGGDAILDDGEAVYTAIVQFTGDAFSLSADTARQLAQDNIEFRTTIARHAQLILAQAQQSAACNASHNLEQRLARWLLRIRDITDSSTSYLTQEMLAQMLGVSRTSVTFVAQSLQNAGLISYRRGHITIERLDALEALSCECYATIRMRYRHLEELEMHKVAAPA